MLGVLGHMKSMMVSLDSSNGELWVWDHSSPPSHHFFKNFVHLGQGVTCSYKCAVINKTHGEFLFPPGNINQVSIIEGIEDH